jgi:hypothetical protein
MWLNMLSSPKDLWVFKGVMQGAFLLLHKPLLTHDIDYAVENYCSIAEAR